MIRALIAAAVALVLALPARAEVEIVEVVSPGGIRAWLVEEPSIPFVALELRFRGGTALDAPGARGAINLMTATLEEGAGDLDARGFAEAQENLAARFSFDSWDDAVTVSARFLTENRAESLALLKLALTRPRFDQDALDRVRAQVLSGLQSDAKDPSTIAGRRFDAIAFGSHPYGSAGEGTIESVTALGRDDILAAKDRVMARDRLFVSAVGDITAAELGPLLDDLLGELPAEGAPMPPRAELTLEPGVTVADFASPQSIVLFGQRGIPRDDPDFFPAFVLNHMLGGGGFGSRLMDEVREKRGLTYGIATYLVNLDLADTWKGSVAAENAKVAEAIALIRSEWARAAHEGFTEAEVEAAKTYLTGSYPLRFDSNATIANILVGMMMQGLPIDYVNTRNDQVSAVTVADVNRVAAELMRAEELQFVVVGRPEGLDGQD